MYKFGKTSAKRLLTCHIDIQTIMNKAIENSPIDFGVAEGERSVERQKELFDAGLSKIDGVTRKGKHNYSPSLAVDIYPFINGAADWDNETLSFLAGFIHGIASQLLEEGKISHAIRWGGNFDMDGEILEQSFDDRPHFELIRP